MVSGARPASPQHEQHEQQQRIARVDDGYWFDGETEQHGYTKPEPRPPTPLPKLQLLVLLYLQLAEPITAYVMLPFLVQLIEETGVTNGDVAKVGHYAGLVQSLFFLAEALTILQWGRLSDRIGRRPVLLIGLFGLCLSMICFGLSHTFWAVVASRALAGALNGNTGVIKSMMGEITDETNVAQGFAFLPLTWNTGNTIAPIIGGFLQHPYERLGGIFRHSEFWRVNPYFLPCGVAGLIAASAFLVAFFVLEETAPCKAMAVAGRRVRRDSELAATEQSPLLYATSAAKTPSPPPPPSLRNLLTPRVLIAILNYSLLAIVDVAFYILQPLMLSTPIVSGGLGMSPSLTGTCLAGFGIAKGLVTALCFAGLTRRFGTKTVTIAGVAAFLGMYALFPLMNGLARADAGLSRRVWVVLVVQLVLSTLPTMGFSCMFIYLTHAAPTRSALGATNGLAQTLTSIMRFIGPASTTSLFAISIEWNLMGGLLVYVVLLVATAVAMMATFLLPAEPWDRTVVS